MLFRPTYQSVKQRSDTDIEYWADTDPNSWIKYLDNGVNLFNSILCLYYYFFLYTHAYIAWIRRRKNNNTDNTAYTLSNTTEEQLVHLLTV